MNFPSPVIVAGMHRSGTSLTASILQTIGINMGDQLLSADANNRRGYYEDTSFLAFHRKVLTACTNKDELGVHDWGWTVSEHLSRDRFSEFEEEGAALLVERQSKAKPWGWKDPRSSLLLDFWQKLAPQTQYVLVYRPPWEMAESMTRVGGDFFTSYPDYVMDIWSMYNESILRFFRQNSQQCLLINIHALIANPDHACGVVQRFLSSQLHHVDTVRDVRELIANDLFHRMPGDDANVSLMQSLHPRSAEIYRRLENVATIPGVNPEGIPAISKRPMVLALELQSEFQRQQAANLELESRLKEITSTAAALEMDFSVSQTALSEARMTIMRLEKEKEEEKQELTLHLDEVRTTLDQLSTQLAATEAAHASAVQEREHYKFNVSLMESTRTWKLRNLLRSLLRPLLRK